ncbi:hypothetical protein LL946_04825 [Knoellia locipacati]|uniref:hypothetical protein n=1 Tax=Knoellia locipacati TaxID=882824 RepID=UPI003850A3C9
MTISGIGALGTFRSEAGAPYFSVSDPESLQAEASRGDDRALDHKAYLEQRLVWTPDQITVTQSPAATNSDKSGSGLRAGSRLEVPTTVPALTSKKVKDDIWPDDPKEVERRLTSAVAVAQFARDAADLHSDHRKRLVNEAIWFWTERGSVSRKYKLRFRTPAALKLQRDLGFSAAAKHLAHEHVHERAAVVLRLLAPDTDIRATLQATEACVVTKEEHHLLASVKGVHGWVRYATVHLHPLDMVTGLPMDLISAAAADAIAWPREG